MSPGSETPAWLLDWFWLQLPSSPLSGARWFSFLCHCSSLSGLTPMVIFSESKAGSNSRPDYSKLQCPGQGEVCGRCGSVWLLDPPLVSSPSWKSPSPPQRTWVGGTPSSCQALAGVQSAAPPASFPTALFQTWRYWPRRAQGGCSRPWRATWPECQRDRPPCWEHRSAVGHKPPTPRSSLSQECVTCFHTHPKAHG